MVFLRFTNTVCDKPLGLILFHHVKLMNHAIIISHCTILVGVKTECNIIFFFKASILFALQSSHFKILNIAFPYATNNGLYKKKPINISNYRNVIPDPLSTTGSTTRSLNAVDLTIMMNISDQLHV